MYKDLINSLRKRGLSNPSSLGHHSGLFDEAADAIEKLQAKVNANAPTNSFIEGCVYCELKSLPGHGDYKFGREFDTEYQASVCIRSYKDGHFVLLYEDEESGSNTIPIRFCPICGEKLKKE